MPSHMSASLQFNMQSTSQPYLQTLYGIAFWKLVSVTISNIIKEGIARSTIKREKKKTRENGKKVEKKMNGSNTRFEAILQFHKQFLG